MVDWQPFPAKAWVWLIALGFAQFFSQILVVVAYRYASAEKVGPFIYSVIAFTAVIGWLVWHHRPTLFMYLGMALVIGGGLIAVRAKAGAPALSPDEAADTRASAPVELHTNCQPVSGLTPTDAGNQMLRDAGITQA